VTVSSRSEPLGVLGGTMIACALMGISLSLAIAMLGLEQMPRLPILQAVIETVPAIELWARVSKFPEHTSLFFAVLWLLTPLLVWLLVENLEDFFPQQRHVRSPRLAAGMFAVAAALVAIVVLGAAAPAAISDQQNSRRSLTHGMLQSRVSMGFFGGLLVFFTCYTTIGCIYFSVRSLKEAGR
jgi:hypothetical protein